MKKSLEEYNEICKKCQEKWQRENPYEPFLEAYCEYCETGLAIHALEDGSDWDRLDKMSTRYRSTSLNGD